MCVFLISHHNKDGGVEALVVMPAEVLVTSDKAVESNKGRIIAHVW